VGVARRRPDFAHCRRFGVQQAAHAERPRIPLSTAVPPYLPRHEPCASKSERKGDHDDQADLVATLAGVRSSPGWTRHRVGAVQAAAAVPYGCRVRLIGCLGSREESMTKKCRRRTTLLELVWAVQDQTRSDAETVAIITGLVNTGQVVLRGIFAGRRVVVG